ncbi:MAG: tRNA-dihydrouridine synthase family protein [Desulfovibrio sp.]|nr:tRNA-dihydrouridine synthase family protein [Desulfovibrio sp.]
MSTHLPFAPNTPWLAPLAGYSDLPFRLLCREYGAACCTTEMISAKGLFYQSPGTKRLLATNELDQPLIVQLFASEPSMLAWAVNTLCEQGFRYFDLNIGCSVPKVMRQHAGAAMLEDPDNILACAKAMIAEAGRGHVGFKLRSSLASDTSLIPALPLALEDAGAGWITLHPRSAKQGFHGTANWDLLAKTVANLHIPVVASGDLLTAQDGLRCLSQTKAATLMYARGALANPTIFRDHILLSQGIEPTQQTPLELKAMLFRHLHLVEQYGQGTNPVARMRGILSAYVRGLPFARNLRMELCQAKTWDALPQILDHWICG